MIIESSSLFRSLFSILFLLNFNLIRAGDPKSGVILNSAVTNSLENAIKKCSLSGCVPANAEANGIYIDASSETEENSSKFTKLIRCTTTSCTSESVDIYNTSTYYLDSSSKIGESTKYEKLIKCYRGEEKIVPDCGSQSGSQCGVSQKRNDKATCKSFEHDCKGNTVKHFMADFEGDQYNDRLISCKSDGCFLEDNDIVGYFKNSDQVDGKIIMCAENDCDILGNGLIFTECEDAGDIIVKNGKHHLCVTDTVSIELSENNKGNYIVNGCEDNIFASEEEKFAIVSVNGDSAYLNKSYSYRYVYADVSTTGKNKVMEYDENACPTKGSGQSTTIDYDNVLEYTECENGICSVVNRDN